MLDFGVMSPAHGSPPGDGMARDVSSGSHRRVAVASGGALERPSAVRPFGRSSFRVAFQPTGPDDGAAHCDSQRHRPRDNGDK